MKRKLLVLIIILLCLLLAVTLVVFLGSHTVPQSAQKSETQTVTEGAKLVPTPLPTLLPAPEAVSVPTPLPQGAARQLALRVDAGGVSPRALTDGNYYTDYTFPAGTTITLEAEEEIVSLYIIFGSYPDEWTLLSDQTRQSCGQDGFLHEYVALDKPSAQLQLLLPDDHEVMIRDIYAYSDGYLPGSVQTWSRLDERDGADILLFSTHYDDELLFFGGLIPYYATVRGLRVQVAYMTSNYLTDFSNYRFRPHEALNGLWVAGTHFYPVTNEVPDIECYSYENAVEHYGEDQFTAFQVEQIRRFKPLVVVTQDENGEYGHGAHILTALSVERAVAAAADPAQFPESAERYGVWNTPKTYLHLYGDPDEYTWLNYEIIAPELGWRSPFQVAQQAYLQHATQQQWVGFYVYSYDHPHDSHRFGLYRSLVGPDARKNDLMENVSREMFPVE